MNIWKFSLEKLSDEVVVDMPSGAKVLDVQTQNGVPNIWALVAPSNSLEPRVFRIVGTGHDFDGKGAYVGTFQLMNGGLVFHVFDQGTPGEKTWAT